MSGVDPNAKFHRNPYSSFEMERQTIMHTKCNMRSMTYPGPMKGGPMGGPIGPIIG